MKWVVYGFLSAALAWLVFSGGGVYTSGASVGIVLLGCACMALALRGQVYERPKPPHWLTVALAAALVVWIVGQTVPLPLSVLRIIAPARAALADGAGLGGPLPLSNSVALTVQRGVFLLACLLAGFAVRQLTCAFEEKLRRVLLPVVCIGAAQAALGLLQVSLGEGVTIARGTYFNRNHFAGLLEMAIPLAVVYGLQSLSERERDQYRQSPLRPALWASVCFGAAAFMLAAVVFSQSRMGFVAALCGLLTVGILNVGRTSGGWKRWLAPATLVALSVGAFVLLPTDELIQRFATIAASEDINSDDRVRIWRDSRQLILDHWATGCGYGAFEPSFTRYQRVAPMHAINFAHNDYAQGLAELGLPGFALAAGLWFWVLGGAFRKWGQGRDEEQSLIRIGCAGALTAISLHAFFDFNAYVPANLLAAVWIGGVAEAVRPNAGVRKHRSPNETKS